MHTVKSFSMIDDKRIKTVRQASITALIGNSFICILKIVFGIIAGSLSVLGDGIDSATDVAVSVMTLLVSFIINRPSDKEHPWGHQRAETMASVILSFIIVTAGFQLFITSSKKLAAYFQGADISIMPSTVAVIVTAVSIIVKLLLALNQFILGKKANSIMILANAKNMANDIILSASVLIGLALSYFFQKPVLDSAAALIISCLIIKSGIELFMELNVELMDGNTNKALYKQLFQAVSSVQGAYNPHRTRIRKMANLLDIDLDIEVDADMSVYEAHIIAEKVTSAIKERIENVYDIVIHIEPKGCDLKDEEGYGLCEKDLAE